MWYLTHIRENMKLVYSIENSDYMPMRNMSVLSLEYFT